MSSIPGPGIGVSSTWAVTEVSGGRSLPRGLLKVRAATRAALVVGGPGVANAGLAARRGNGHVPPRFEAGNPLLGLGRDGDHGDAVGVPRAGEGGSQLVGGVGL